MNYSDTLIRPAGSDIAPPGADSVTWRIHGDPMMWIAGLRALYLQALHPRVIRGFVQNSDYRDSAWSRLSRTADYVGWTTFGTVEQAHRAAARIRRVHARLTADDPDTGERYRIDDPDLLAWVHCCEIDSYLHVIRRAGMRLSRADADAYVREQRWRAWLIGADLADIPTDATSLRRYFTAVRPLLAGTREARDAAKFVLFPPMSRRLEFTPARPGWAGVAGLAFATLPGWARRMYGLRGPTELAYPGVTAALITMRTGMLAVPRRLRDGPHVKAARNRIASGQAR